MIEKLHFQQLLAMIGEFESPKSGVFVHGSSPLNGCTAKIKASGKSFELRFELQPKGRDKVLGRQFKRMAFQTERMSYHLEGLFIHKMTPPEYKGVCGFVRTMGHSLVKKYYYRLLIPLTKEIQLHFILGRARHAIINDDRIDFRFLKDDQGVNYLCIDSTFKQSFRLFSEKVFSLKTALGYLSGHWPGDKGYFFAYGNRRMIDVKHVYHCELRKSINGQYVPVYSNPFGYIRNKKTAQKYYSAKTLRPINENELSNLCQKLFDSVEMSSVIMLILESTAASLLFMPGGLAIALETLADLIKPDEKARKAPMTKAVRKKVVEECTEVLNRYRVEIGSHENYTILFQRVEQLNQAANSAKLRAPFDHLGIPLFEKDIQILNSRNDLLHGRVPDITGAGKTRSTERLNKDLYYTSMRLYTLLNLLILKWIGFDNRVVNHAKIQEGYTKIRLKEDPHRLLS
jgi:hypothetical protein